MRTPENGWSESEAGMAQLDDIVGAVMQKLKDDGLDDNTIVMFTTDNGTENFTWPDGGQTPFAGGKGTVLEGGFRVPCIARWPGKFPPAKSRTKSSRVWIGSRPSCRWRATRTSPKSYKAGKQLGDRTYKVHLDGYNQMEIITGKGPSKRHEIFYFAEGTLGAVRFNDYKYRFIDQPSGWLGGTVKVDWPILVELPSRSVRADRHERLDRLLPLGSSTSSGASFWCSRSSETRRKRRSSFRRCRRVRRSTWKRLRSRSKRPQPRTRRARKRPSNPRIRNGNGLA